MRRASSPSREYTFKHALTHEVAYGSLLQERRRVLHARIVEALEGAPADRLDEQVERLAHHALGARCGRRRSPTADRRGRGPWNGRPIARPWAPSSRRSAPCRICQRSTTRARRPSTSGSPCAPRSGHSSDFGRILTSLREAEALAAALDDPRRLGQVSGLLAEHFRFMGAYDQAIAAAQRALALATASGDVVLQALASRDLGLAYQAQGAYQPAIDALGQTIASLEGPRRHERFGRVILPAVISRAYLAWCHAEVGTFAAGRTLGDAGLRIAEAVEHPVSVMIGSWGIGLLWLHQGDLPRALPLLERAVGICREIDLPLYFPRIAVPLGAAYTLGGRSAEAVSLLTQALEQTMATAMVVYQALCRRIPGGGPAARWRSGGGARPR